MNDPVLTTRALTKRYGSHTALTEATLDIPAGIDLISADHTDRQTTLIVHNTNDTPLDLPGAEPLGLEDMVLTYLHRAEGTTAPTLQETHA